MGKGTETAAVSADPRIMLAKALYATVPQSEHFNQLAQQINAGLMQDPRDIARSQPPTVRQFAAGESFPDGRYIFSEGGSPRAIVHYPELGWPSPIIHRDMNKVYGPWVVDDPGPDYYLDEYSNGLTFQGALNQAMANPRNQPVGDRPMIMQAPVGMAAPTARRQGYQPPRMAPILAM